MSSRAQIFKSFKPRGRQSKHDNNSDDDDDHQRKRSSSSGRPTMRRANATTSVTAKIGTSSDDDEEEEDSDKEYRERKKEQEEKQATAEAMDDDAFRRRASRSSRRPSSRSTTTAGLKTKTVLGERERHIYDYLPDEFLEQPKQAEPILFFLPRLLALHHRAKMGGGYNEAQPDIIGAAEGIPLIKLLQAAEEDVRLHRARVQAGLHHDPRLVRTFKLTDDAHYKERQERLEQRAAYIRDLEEQAEAILKNLDESAPQSTSTNSQGLTLAERQQKQLQHWQRALELYVYAPNQDSSTLSSSTALRQTRRLDWQPLFEQLLAGVADDQDMADILGQASDMCEQLVHTTRQMVQDAAETVREYETAHVIRLEAHQLFARGCLQQVRDIEDQFKSSGRAALQIGHQLEHAELKRSQCEAASILIRRWWILEALAEQEAATGTPIDVEKEIVLRLVPAHACKLDPLFTQPENSLEAARALKSLRAVVRSKGSTVAAGGSTVGGGTSGVMNVDKTSSKRFALTASLISRISEALEKRLLDAFTRVYKAGGTYDFSAKKQKPGSIDWRELRSLAQALLFFDSARSLHKRFIDMVVSSRFPELFQRNENKPEFDMDATRSKLSSLFHKVSDVCTAEFELIAHVFGSDAIERSRTDLLEGSEEMHLVVARALLQRVISDHSHGLQARINDLLASIDREGDFEAGAKKLDTFVVIHEKAAGLFGLLRDAADKMLPDEDDVPEGLQSEHVIAARQAVESLKGFLTSQELALSNTHRQGYINLELRLLHHHCCNGLDQAGCTLVKGPPPRPNTSLAEKGILEEYKAPVLPLYKDALAKSGFTGILAGPLKQSVLRQPLIHATDSLLRARLMFGTGKRGETTARLVLCIYTQLCSFYGQGLLYPIIETLREMLPSNPPSQPPQLPFDEEAEAPDLGVQPAFWVALERVHSAAKSFDRELWAENRIDGHRVWETLRACNDNASLAIASDERLHFYTELERRGEAAILQALDTLSAYIQWILVTGGEAMLATGGTRIFNQLTGQSGGPYAIPSGSSLETPNSPAVKSLTYCLRVQFVHVQAALTPQSLASFWTALSMRLYDILVARLLQHYTVTTVGAVILSRDVEALRSVAMLAGTDHEHWDVLRELLTLFMTPPDAIKVMLIGPEGETSKGLFAKAGRDKCLVFLSRRNDFRYKTAAGLKKSGWVTDLLSDLNTTDPTDHHVNIGLFAAGRRS